MLLNYQIVNIDPGYDEKKWILFSKQTCLVTRVWDLNLWLSSFWFPINWKGYWDRYRSWPYIKKKEKFSTSVSGFQPFLAFWQCYLRRNMLQQHLTLFCINIFQLYQQQFLLASGTGGSCREHIVNKLYLEPLINANLFCVHLALWLLQTWVQNSCFIIH